MYASYDGKIHKNIFWRYLAKESILLKNIRRCIHFQMSSLTATKGKALFNQASGHGSEQNEDDDFDLEFSDSDSEEETKSNGGAMAFGADGAMTFGVVEETETEAMAVKPFIGAIFPPSNFSTHANDTSTPSASLTLEHVFGYCKKSRFIICSFNSDTSKTQLAFGTY